MYVCSFFTSVGLISFKITSIHLVTSNAVCTSCLSDCGFTSFCLLVSDNKHVCTSVIQLFCIVQTSLQQTDLQSYEVVVIVLCGVCACVH